MGVRIGCGRSFQTVLCNFRTNECVSDKSAGCGLFCLIPRATKLWCWFSFSTFTATQKVLSWQTAFLHCWRHLLAKLPPIYRQTCQTSLFQINYFHNSECVCFPSYRQVKVWAKRLIGSLIVYVWLATQKSKSICRCRLFGIYLASFLFEIQQTFLLLFTFLALSRRGTQSPARIVCDRLFRLM